jgi:hypothetical protein
MEVRIKNGEEMIDATIEMVDGVMVVSPKVEKFVPKDGDVISSDRAICIFKEEYGSVSPSFSSYVALVNEIIGFGSTVFYETRRPATEEEKKLLFDKLKEKSWEWDVENKELVKLKWKPKVNEYFYYPSYIDGGSFEASVSHYDEQSDIDDDLDVQNGMCFKTEQECQEFCKRLNSCISSIKP